jgi:hypothetical protein
VADSLAGPGDHDGLGPQHLLNLVAGVGESIKDDLILAVRDVGVCTRVKVLLYLCCTVCPADGLGPNGTLNMIAHCDDSDDHGLGHIL